MKDYAKIITTILLRYYRTPDNDELNSMKKRVLRQIKRVLDDNQIDQNDEWSVEVLNDERLMAFTTDNKCIVVTTRLLETIDDNLLAAVLAFEITCYMDNHRKKRYFVKIISYSTIFTSFFFVSNLSDAVIFSTLSVVQILQIHKFNKYLDEDAFNKACMMTNKFVVDKNDLRLLLKTLKRSNPSARYP